jgi:hypothetical protein
VRDDLLPLVFLLWVVGFPTALFREESQGHCEFVVDLAGRRKALSIVLSPSDFDMIVDLKRTISSQLQSLRSDLVRRARVGGRAAEVSVSKGDSGISLHLKLLNLITRFSGQKVWGEGLKAARGAKLGEEGLSGTGPSIPFSEVFKERVSGNIWSHNNDKSSI